MGGREAPEGEDVHILITDSCCYTAEPTQHCKTVILQLKFKIRIKTIREDKKKKNPRVPELYHSN